LLSYLTCRIGNSEPIRRPLIGCSVMHQASSKPPVVSLCFPLMLTRWQGALKGIMFFCCTEVGEPRSHPRWTDRSFTFLLCRGRGARSPAAFRGGQTEGPGGNSPRAARCGWIDPRLEAQCRNGRRVRTGGSPGKKCDISTRFAGFQG
jgi:hypothetical protein